MNDVDTTRPLFKGYPEGSEADVTPRQIVEVSPDSLGRRWFRVQCWGCESAAIEGRDRAALEGPQFCLMCRPSAQCGVMSEALVGRDIPHHPCDREVGHRGLHVHEAL